MGPAIEISGGQARNASLGDKGAVFLQAVGTNQDISADVMVTASGSNSGVLGRWNDASNYYFTYVDVGLGGIRLHKMVVGVGTLLGAATKPVAFNTFYRLRLVIYGDSLQVYFNNEVTPSISVTDTSITAGSNGGISAYSGTLNSSYWKNFNIAAAAAPAPLFSDNFDRTTGMGPNWNVWYNATYTADGTFAISGAPPINGNWASVVPALGTNNYAVVSDLIIPPGSLFSGLVARGAAAAFDSDLYAAQISTDGAVHLSRRNNWTWLELTPAVASGIVASTRYTLKLVATGTNPVHLEVWLNGVLKITFDDVDVNRLQTGGVGIENYDANVKYTSFAVFGQ